MTSEAEQDAGQSLRALGWHQGALIAVPGALTDLAFGCEHAVVASQDCDVVALTANEPAVDLLPATIQSVADADLLYGKNPRRLCLALANGTYATVDVRQRVTLAKHLVVGIEPLANASVTQRDRRLLAKWLGKRYARPAFPDTFNNRLGMQRKKLDKLSKRDEGKLITTFFVMLNTEEELTLTQAYELVIWFAHRFDDVDSVEQRASLEKYASDFAAALDTCDGIKLVACSRWSATSNRALPPSQRAHTSDMDPERVAMSQFISVLITNIKQSDQRLTGEPKRVSSPIGALPAAHVEFSGRAHPAVC